MGMYMKIEWKNCIRMGVSAFVLFLAIYHWRDVIDLLRLLLSAALPLLLGGIIAYILNILMTFYESHYFRRHGGRFAQKSKRPVCMLAALLTLIAVVVLISVLVVPQVVSGVQLLLADAPPAIEQLLNNLLNNLKKYEWLADEVDNLEQQIDWQTRISEIIDALKSRIGNVMGFLAGTVSSVVSVVVTSVIAIIFSVYMLASKEVLVKQIDRLMVNYLPQRRYEKACHILQVLNESFHKYIVGQCLEALILGVLCTIGMLIIRLPYATMIGALIAFTALIPIAGAYIGAGVGAFMILTVSPIKALIFLIYIVILQQLEGNLIYPKVVGSSIGLPGIWVLAAVTIGGSLMGVLGMLLMVPLFAAGYKLLREDVNRREALKKELENS